MKKYLVGLFLLAFLVMPLATNAQSSTDEIQRLIASLRQQIAALQAQLAQLRGGQSGEWCFTFNRNMGVGASGREVRELHTALGREGFPVPVAVFYTARENENDDDRDEKIKNGTERYTEATAAAVSQFQLKYKDEILTPNGLSAPTGYFGPSSRKVMNRLYGCDRITPPIPGNRPPTISGVSGPTALKVGETGTWTVRASDPENGTLYYSVVWGDEGMMGSGNVISSETAAPVQQTATFTHTYASVGTYYPQFKITDNSGQSAQTSLSVVVGGETPSEKQYINVLSPNGGENWLVGSNQNVKWTWSGPPNPSYPNWPSTNHNVYLVEMGDKQIWTLGRGIDSRVGSNGVGFAVRVPSVPEGNYRVRVCDDYLNYATKSCDDSDSYFRITNPTITPALKIISPNGGNGINVSAGSTLGVFWSGGQPDWKINIFLIDTRPDYYTSNSPILIFNTENDGREYVSIPANIQTASGYKIRVACQSCSTGTPGWTDDSDNAFPIDGIGSVTNSVQVLSPNGGENWKKGRTYEIKWDSTGGIERVYIKLRKNSVGDTVLAVTGDEMINNTGSYSWTVPSTLADGNDYVIRVISENGQVLDDSNQPFSITTSSENES